MITEGPLSFDDLKVVIDFAATLCQITFALCFVYRFLNAKEQGFDNIGVFKD